MIPILRIDPWPAGTRDWEHVHVVKIVDGGGHMLFCQADLATARLIVAVFDAARDAQFKLNAIVTGGK